MTCNEITIGSWVSHWSPRARMGTMGCETLTMKCPTSFENDNWVLYISSVSAGLVCVLSSKLEEENLLNCDIPVNPNQPIPKDPQDIFQFKKRQLNQFQESPCAVLCRIWQVKWKVALSQKEEQNNIIIISMSTMTHYRDH